MSKPVYPTLKTYLAALGPERDCRWLLRRVRWPKGDCCPRCGDQQVSLLTSGLNAIARSRTLFRCWACDYHFSVTAGTIFHDTHLEIRAWLLAIYLMESIENGARVAQIETYLGVSHETAVNMARRIRELTEQDEAFVQRCVRLPKSYVNALDPATPNRNRHPTLHAIVCKFATEERTLEHVARILWPTGPTCPRCQKREVRKVRTKRPRNRPPYWCLRCEKQFTLTSGNRDLQGIHCLSEWFIALYLMESTPSGVPPKQLERLLGINYRTAVSLIEWFRGKEERRKFLFDLYIGSNDPAEFHKEREAIKKERRLIQEHKAKPL
jgi:transposase-like protein